MSATKPPPARKPPTQGNVSEMSELVGPLTIMTTAGGITVAGEIDASTVTALAQALMPYPEGTTVFEVDMSAVEFIDSSGLRVLIQAHQHAVTNGQRLVIANPSSIVSRLFEVSGLTELFNMAGPAD
jgi:anti-sigma B factor antagonist